MFAFLSQIRAFILPGLLVLVGASARGGNDWWQPWMMAFVIPNAAIAVVRYISYRYRYDPNEMVIRSGLLFKRERHIPYGRIQNVDAVQNVLHRLLKVVEVRVETGGGQAPEATMSVLPFTAFLEMRARVFAERQAIGTARQEAAPAAAIETPPATLLLELPAKELLLCGFLENRGGVLIAAGFGLIWELGLIDRIMTATFGNEVAGRRLVRDFIRSNFDGAGIAFDRIVIAIAAFIGFLLFVRILSMAWALIRLYGFRLTLSAGDLRSEFGLTTRVAATIPLRRIQTLTIREGPLHRLFDRVAVRADTAGGQPKDGSGVRERESLAPILRRSALTAFIHHVLPDVDGLETVAWRRVSPRAFRREVKGWLVLSALAQIALFALLGLWSLMFAPLLLAWAIVAARKTVAHLGWAVTEDAVFFRTGWLWRRLSIVRLAKIQTVTLATSPFDRRSAMARVRVDTAGASELTRIVIPYLPQDVGQALHLQLAHEAAGTRFLW
jgi:putative membrane protein